MNQTRINFFDRILTTNPINNILNVWSGTRLFRAKNHIMNFFGKYFMQVTIKKRHSKQNKFMGFKLYLQPQLRQSCAKLKISSMDVTRHSEPFL
jgi:hypothetical protein